MKKSMNKQINEHKMEWIGHTQPIAGEHPVFFRGGTALGDDVTYNSFQNVSENLLLIVLAQRGGGGGVCVP